MKKIFYPLMAIIALAAISCEETMIIEKTDPDPQLDLFENEVSVIGSEVQVEFQTSKTLAFTSSSVSYVEAVLPAGWKSSTSMDNNTLTITAPDYSDTQAAASGPVTLKIFDGSGEFIEKSFNVKATDCEFRFDVPEINPEGVQIFSLGGITRYVCDKSANVGSYNVELPNGWKLEPTDEGFSLTAPLWTPESGFDQDGTVTVTPVTYAGTAYSDYKKTFNVHVDEKATFQFAEPGKYTFNFGETREINMIVAGMKSLDNIDAPEGWTIDTSALLSDGKVKVTAPAGNAAYNGYGELAFEGTQVGIEKTVASEDNIILRVRGVNSRQDLLDFRDAHGATGELNVDFSKLSPWLVDGELKFNADIELGQSDMYAGVPAYFIHHMYVPINGNGHTLTMNFTSSKGICGLFQHLHCEAVHDLNLAGTITATSATGSAFVLAQQNKACNLTVTNVNSTVTVISEGNAKVGGLMMSAENNKTLRLVNCNVSGDIILNQCPSHCGGIIATGTGDGKAGTGLLSIEGCTYSGHIIYNKDGKAAHNKNARIGGIIGSQERNGEIKNCTFNGEIQMYLNNTVLFSSTGGGIGGIVGRVNAETSGYVMKTLMKECKSDGKIRLVSANASERMSNIGLYVGMDLGTLTQNDCTAEGSIVNE